MDYNLSDISNAHARALFAIGDTVTIQIFDKDGTDVTPDSPDDECDPYGELDTFQWPYSDLDSLPSSFEEYSWIMTNLAGDKQRDVDSFASVPKTIFHIPFEIDIIEFPVFKGDSWEPEIRIDTNAPDLMVAVELTDMDTTFNFYTSNIEGGGDDQILLISDTETYKIYRLLMTGVQTGTFASRFMDLTISAGTQIGQLQTTRKEKIPFQEVSAINFSPVS